MVSTRNGISETEAQIFLAYLKAEQASDDRMRTQAIKNGNDELAYGYKLMTKTWGRAAAAFELFMKTGNVPQVL
jgi:hypothetical protein